MQIQAPDSKSQYYLREQNGMIRLGDVFFSFQKLKAWKSNPTNALSQFYPPDYIERQVSKLYRELVKLQYETQNKEITEHPYKHFRLESVHEYQYRYVQMTFQQLFVLKCSNFKILEEWKNHPTLGEDHLWSINFMNLKHLSLSNSNIFSIERLAYCNLPVLEKLELHKNQITNFSISSKLSFPKLKELTLYENRLIELDQITRLGASEMKFMDIDQEVNRQNDHLMRMINRDGPETVLVQKVDFITKSQFLKKISEFRLKMNKRVIGKTFKKALEESNKEMKYEIEVGGIRRANRVLLFQRQRRPREELPLQRQQQQDMEVEQQEYNEEERLRRPYHRYRGDLNRLL